MAQLKSTNIFGTIKVHSLANSINTASGSVVVSGGVGISKTLYVGENLFVLGNATLTGAINGLTISSTTKTLNMVNASLYVGAAGDTGTVTLKSDGTSPTTIIGPDNGTATLQSGTMAITEGKLSQFALTTSAELAGVISGETGSGALVFGTSPTLTTPTINDIKASAGTTTADLWSEITTGSIAIGAGLTTGTLNIDASSTKAHTLNLGTGTTGTGLTKTVNIGTGGASGSTTNINIGSSTTGSINNTSINGSLGVSGNTGIGGDLTVSGNLIISGDSTSITTQDLLVEDKDIVLASGNTSDSNSNNGGIILKGATDKKITWGDEISKNWNSTENFNLSVNKVYKINNVSVLSSTTLGGGVVNSSLTSVGTIGDGTWQGDIVGSAYGGTGVNNAYTLSITGANKTIAGAASTLTLNKDLTVQTGDLTLTAGASGTNATFPASGSITLVDTKTAQVLTNKKLGSLTSNGFVKTSGGDGTLSVDTNTYSLDNHVHTFGSLTEKPSTISGYGITDAMTTSHDANEVSSTDISNWNDAHSDTTDATNTNTASTIVKRDISGNFSAGTITASLTGDVTGNVTGNVTGKVNGLTIDSTTGTLDIANGKKLTVNNTITLAGTDDTTNATFPAGTITLADLGTAQTLTNKTLTSPTINNIVASDAADLWSELSTANATLMSSQTSGTITIGGIAQTGTITFDRSTKAHTLSIGSGATEAAQTKVINIGAGGVATSITNINIGSSVASSVGTTTISSLTAVKISRLTKNGPVYTSGDSGTLNSEEYLDVTRGGTGVGTLTLNGVLYGNGTSDIAATAAGTTGQYLKATTNGAPAFATIANGEIPSALTGKTYNGYMLADACAKPVTDSSSASAISTGTSLPTERDIYYGLPTINNAHDYTSSTKIYAPTAGGASGTILIGAGTTSAPTWSTAKLTLPGSDDTLMGLGAAQTITGEKTFENSTIKIKGSSTGVTTLTSANTSANSYTITIPAIAGTLITNKDTGTVSNEMLAGSIDYDKLTEYAISGVSLGSNLYSLSAGDGLTWSTGSTYNGSSASTISVDTTAAGDPSIYKTLTTGSLTIANALTNGTVNIANGNAALTANAEAVNILSGAQTATSAKKTRTLNLGSNGSNNINTNINIGTGITGTGGTIGINIGTGITGIGAGGTITLGTASKTVLKINNDIEFVNASSMLVEPSTSNTAGKNLTISAGSSGAKTTAGTLTGGDLILCSGKNVGNTTSKISFKVASGTADGTALNDLSEIAYIDKRGFVGNLTGNVTGNVSGTSSNVTGIISVSNGGTGATTHTANALLKGDGVSPIKASNISDNGTIIELGIDSKVTGNLEVTGYINESSDRRLKTEINNITGALDKVKNLTGCTFKKVNSDKVSMGLIAQDTQEVIPEVVNEGSDGYLGIQYSNIVALLIEAIKEQQEQIDYLKSKVDKKKWMKIF